MYLADGYKFHVESGISISRNFVKIVTRLVVPAEGHAQYIILEHDRQSIDILNVYAPNNTRGGTRLSKKLVEYPFMEVD